MLLAAAQEVPPVSGMATPDMVGHSNPGCPIEAVEYQPDAAGPVRIPTSINPAVGVGNGEDYGSDPRRLPTTPYGSTCHSPSTLRQPANTHVESYGLPEVDFTQYLSLPETDELQL